MAKTPKHQKLGFVTIIPNQTSNNIKFYSTKKRIQIKNIYFQPNILKTIFTIAKKINVMPLANTVRLHLEYKNTYIHLSGKGRLVGWLPKTRSQDKASGLILPLENVINLAFLIGFAIIKCISEKQIKLSPFLSYNH